jgi:hypothetical protein
MSPTNAEEELECPVCLNVIPDGVEGGITCRNGHTVCMACMSKMLVPKPPCEKPDCCGIGCPCVVCRVSGCIRPGHLLAITRGGWDQMNDLFESNEALHKWTEERGADKSECINVDMRSVVSVETVQSSQ